MKYNVIVIDDELNIQRSVKTCLDSSQYKTETFGDPLKALLHIQESCVDIAIIDICLKDHDGIAFYRRLRSSGHDFPVIFISGNASLSEAATCMKLGAFDFLEKPFTGEKLLFTLKNCVEQQRLRSRLLALETRQNEDDIFGDHSSIKSLRNEIGKVARVDSVVLISGESGTGKELIAQNIHQQSARESQAFIKVNCSAIPENLHESALFGHVKGAFTGADNHKKGYFEAANHGTLFLDEIGDMSLVTQASLLRVLENREIQKVGSDKITEVDVRIIAASHKNLKQEAEKGNFREDLYYRLSVIPLVSPALRERASDIPLLTAYLMKKVCARLGLPEKVVTQGCAAALQAYAWPGNVRELINILERMVILGGEILTKDDIPLEISHTKDSSIAMNTNLTFKAFKQEMEREFLVQCLQQYGGNISQVAKSLDMDRTHLHKKLAQYEIKREHFFE
ncbi:MAG: Fis family transcriptional regulator [Alteromonadaceae bacterium]|nr:MAG: Fis family transcriptional regulator [Alteromonadaceae bacterium]